MITILLILFALAITVGSIYYYTLWKNAQTINDLEDCDRLLNMDIGFYYFYIVRFSGKKFSLIFHFNKYPTQDDLLRAINTQFNPTLPDTIFLRKIINNIQVPNRTDTNQYVEWNGCTLSFERHLFFRN